MSAKQYDGDVSVGHDVTVGGRAKINGSMKVGHNLKVEGWIDAPNVKGQNKGLFKTLTALAAAYPKPRVGWYALVGESLPATVYIVENGEWTATTGTGGGDTVDLASYEDRLEDVEAAVATAKNRADDAYTMATNAGASATAAQTTANQGVSKAAEAQTTAESAKTAAQAATTMATNAQTTANAAKVTAEQASSLVADAQQSATNAETVANAAKSAATVANSNAQTALETADDADSKADAATDVATAAKAKAVAAETAVKGMAWLTVNGTRSKSEPAEAEIDDAQYEAWSTSGTWHVAFHRGYNRFVCVMHSGDVDDCEGGDAYCKWKGSTEYNNADGTARTDRTYVMDGRVCTVCDGELVAVGESDKRWFRAFFNLLCGAILPTGDKSYGGYDYATDKYTLNGLTLTEAEARRIAMWSNSAIINSDTTVSFAGNNERTVLPLLLASKSGAGRSMASAFAYDLYKEAISFRHGTNDYCCASSIFECFAGNPALKTIEGLRLASGAPTQYAFWHCYALQTLQLYNLDSDLDLGDCSKLSQESVAFIVAQSNCTEARTLTLHADVYARLTQLQIADALAKNISIAQASADDESVNDA